MELLLLAERRHGAALNRMPLASTPRERQLIAAKFGQFRQLRSSLLTRQRRRRQMPWAVG